MWQHCQQHARDGMCFLQESVVSKQYNMQRVCTQDAKMFRRKKWKYLILDEAHMIKNWKSQRWQTLLNFNSKRRLLITGQPSNLTETLLCLAYNTILLTGCGMQTCRCLCIGPSLALAMSLRPVSHQTGNRQHCIKIAMYDVLHQCTPHHTCFSHMVLSIAY